MTNSPDPRALIETATPCPVCKGEGRVYRMTPAYEAISQQAGAMFGWAGPTHEWRTCHPCRGTGLLYLPALLDAAEALERLMGPFNKETDDSGDENQWWWNHPEWSDDEPMLVVTTVGDLRAAREVLARLKESTDD